MSTSHREAPHHRNLTCVKEYRCRRPECVRRSSEYERRRYRLKGYGTWQPLVDATPVRNHAEALRNSGHSNPDIQRLAGISEATLTRILYDGVNKRANRVRPDVAKRILAVPLAPAKIKPNTCIDATGTRRRIQALVAMGWTLKALGPHLGFHPRRLTDLLYTDRVLASTARRIADGYRALQTRNPAAYGLPEWQIARARRLAARNEWHGPLAWDDIDDPTAVPEISAPYAPPAQNGRDSMRMAELEHLLSLGESETAIAKQMGASEAYIHDLAVLIRNRKTATATDLGKAA